MCSVPVRPLNPSEGLREDRGGTAMLRTKKETKLTYL